MKEESASQQLPRATLLVSLFLGLTLIVLAAPRTLVETALAVAQPTLQAAELHPTEPAPTLGLARGIIDTAEAIRLDSRAYEYAGRIRAAEARATDADADRAFQLSQDAASHFARALAIAPMNSWNWYRYTHALFATRQYLEAARAWRMSVETGVFDYRTVYQRAQAGLALWPYMDLAARDAFGRQLIAIWRWEPGGLVGLLHRFGAGDKGIQALSPWPDAQEAVRIWLDRLARLAN